MADMAVEEKKAKGTAENITLRTSPESKEKWAQRIERLGWKNNTIVDNVLALLDKDARPDIDPEYEKLRESFIINSGRAIGLFDGLLAQAREINAKVQDANKDSLASKDRQIMELQKQLDEATKEKDDLKTELATQQDTCAAKEKELVELRIQLATMTAALNKITNIQQELDDTKERLADAEQKVATQK